MEGVFFIENISEPLYISLYHAITKEIYEGKLKADDKMPSIRNLSKLMNISRTTIENTYSQLIAEGYLYSKPQKGYYVMPLHLSNYANAPQENKLRIDVRLSSKDVVKEDNKEKEETTYIEYDYVSEYVEPANFNMTVWKKNVNHIMNDDEYELFHYSKPFGEDQLKDQIASYFIRVRGIKTTREQIFISAGTQSLLGSLAILLSSEGYNTLSMENPGFNLAKEVFKQNGYNIKGVGLKNNVLNSALLDNQRKQVLFTSPSYQFPFGEIMPMQTRYQILNWAKETNSIIIEDDYNNELRYLGKPVPSLQGIDQHDKVVYLGSFSTLLVPSIRISFMVLPIELEKKYKRLFINKVQSASKLEQLALARMIETGDFAKHIRKIRKAYKTKNQKLNTLLKKHISQVAGFEIAPAGSTVIIELKKEIYKEELLRLCNEKKIKLSLLSEYLIENNSKLLEKFLVLNYRGINECDLEKSIIIIKELICRLY